MNRSHLTASHLRLSSGLRRESHRGRGLFERCYHDIGARRTLPHRWPVTRCGEAVGRQAAACTARTAADGREKEHTAPAVIVMSGGRSAQRTGQLLRPRAPIPRSPSNLAARGRLDFMSAVSSRRRPGNLESGGRWGTQTHTHTHAGCEGSLRDECGRHTGDNISDPDEPNGMFPKWLESFDASIWEGAPRECLEGGGR